MSLHPVFTSSLGRQGTTALWLRWPYPDCLFFSFGAITCKNVNATRSKLCIFRALSLPCSPTRRAAGALPLPAGRAPALPAPGASSAGVQLRTVRSLESLPNQAFCYLAQVTAIEGKVIFRLFPILDCISLCYPCIHWGKKCKVVSWLQSGSHRGKI